MLLELNSFDFRLNAVIAENGFDRLCVLGHNRSNLLIIKIREGPIIMHRDEMMRASNGFSLNTVYPKRGVLTSSTLAREATRDD